MVDSPIIPLPEACGPVAHAGRSSTEVERLTHAYADGVRAFCDGDYPQAIRRFQQALVAQPGDAGVRLALAHTFLHAGDAEKALDFYARLEAEGCEEVELRYNRALLRYQRGHFDKAVPELEGLLHSAPRLEPGAFYLGLMFSSRGEFFCDISLHLGKYYREAGVIERAEKAFAKALEFDAGNITAHQSLGELAILRKNYQLARKHLKRVLDLSPLEEDRINAHNNLGIACYENGAMDEAIDHLTLVLRQSPANPSAIHNLNYIYEREGMFDRDERLPRAIRFMDVHEAALPIFDLAAEGGTGEEGALAIVGRSTEMLKVMRHARIAAASDKPVVITGESGTGKELLARVISLNSSRRDAPFTVVNCTSLTEVLLESELFGHDKGAFTGARARKLGQFELSRGGTVFLDEVTALTPMLQGRLLRAVQEGAYCPMGDGRPMALEVRLIAATNRDLAALVKEGKFREDLYYALNVLPVAVPPLRERAGDVPLLVGHFLRRFARADRAQQVVFSDEDLMILMNYEWPGNVRELENLIERAVIMGSQSGAYLEELARLRRGRASEEKIRKLRDSNPKQVTYAVETTLAELEKQHILTVLETTDNNQKQAAELLGINPSTLWRKLKTYGVGK